MEKLKHIKCDLEQAVYEELEANEQTNFKHINTHEMGEVIDMIKDITQAIYYCSVVKAMEEHPEAIGVTMNVEKI